MTHPGTSSHPLRVAIIGAGPAGFYAASHLFKKDDLVVEVDMFDRLPTPFGLVRAGVAPDHQKIKSVTKAFDKVARHPHFRYFGYVEIGKDISVAELRAHYHQIIYSTGTESARKLNIPGEDLQGSHAATEFVGWINGHPDYQNFSFDFSQERVAVIGMGNVAMDVARLLSKTPEELANTDIADHALEALRHSRIKEIFILGRRGPAQAACTIPELKELGILQNTVVRAFPTEVELDEMSRTITETNGQAKRKVDILQAYARQQTNGDSHRLITFRFLVSPVALIDNGVGRVSAIRLAKNELYATETGGLRPKPTGQYEDLAVGLVFRSIGYRGGPLPDVPFQEQWGIIPNEMGRILNPETMKPLR